jgi:hypothetical protein
LLSVLKVAPTEAQVIVFHSSLRLKSEFEGESEGSRVISRLRQRVRDVIDQRRLRVSLELIGGRQNPALSRVIELRQRRYFEFLGEASEF